MKMTKINKSTKEKIDSILGINENSTIDNLFDELTKNEQNIKNSFSEIDSKVKNNIQQIDNSISNLQKNNITSNSIDIKSIDDSLNEIKNLIEYAKQMFKHIYEAVITTDLIDSELISSTAKLLESIHLNISEFILLYKEKQEFINQIKILIFKQEQKKEILAIQHNYEMEKIKSRQSLDNTCINTENMTGYNQEEIIKLLSNNNI